ncbi:hypothetical protein EVAR_57918_1 [Eumeta japonica]|uniref:Uncharacterized protein n=1 Tax=Eumeta variegata TaxID=151549 RepID=A0A4C1ZVN1_EUMVA|nr:hypothetical protein EVAR_57918_1 [Eumeta japonica]
MYWVRFDRPQSYIRLSRKQTLDDTAKHHTIYEFLRFSAINYHVWEVLYLAYHNVDFLVAQLIKQFPFKLCAAAVSLLLGPLADGVEERLLVPRSRSRARLRRNATSHAFSCVQPAFIDL